MSDTREMDYLLFISNINTHILSPKGEEMQISEHHLCPSLSELFNEFDVDGLMQNNVSRRQQFRSMMNRLNAFQKLRK